MSPSTPPSTTHSPVSHSPSPHRSLWQRGHLSLHCHCQSPGLPSPAHPALPRSTSQLSPSPAFPSPRKPLSCGGVIVLKSPSDGLHSLRASAGSPLLVDQPRVPLGGTRCPLTPASSHSLRASQAPALLGIPQGPQATPCVFMPLLCCPLSLKSPRHSLFLRKS